MKKTATLFVILWGAVNVGAQSTCEMRVDAHQDATTNQRVNYCLVPGYGVEEKTGPTLVSSMTEMYVLSEGENAPRELRPTAKEARYEADKVQVIHNLVQTPQFPRWTDGRVSEQYKLEYQEAMTSGPQTAEELMSKTECDPEKDGGWLDAGEEETAAGLKSRQKKPGRRWIEEFSGELPPLIRVDNLEESGTSDSYAYDGAAYAPALDMVSQGQQPVGYTPEDTAQSAAQTASQDIAAGTYEYAPADLPTIDVSAAPNAADYQEIPAGEYSYAPAE